MNPTELGFWMSAFCAALTGGNASHIAERYADDAVRLYRCKTMPLGSAEVIDTATVDGKVGSPILGPILGTKAPSWHATTKAKE